MSERTFESIAPCVDAIVERVGKKLIVGTPLAVGKPNQLLNGLYQRACKDPSIELTIATALTLQRPQPKSDLERRFLEPFAERLFGDYVDLDYEADRVKGTLPSNIRVLEFYFAPAKYKGNPTAQRDHVCSNYTHVVRDLLDRGVNVLVQQVAEATIEGKRRFSLSCNPDLTVDMLEAFEAQPEKRKQVVFVAQVNNSLPFMYGDAEVDPARFDFEIHNPALNCQLFGPPRMAVSDIEHMIALHVSTLIRDGGELQVGIGSLGDAIVHALLLRHQRNDEYQQAIETMGLPDRYGDWIDRLGGTQPFEEGLFAGSEMIVEGFLHLLKNGVIKRRVYDDIALQRLLNAGTIDENVSPATLDALLETSAVKRHLDEAEFRYLKHFGVFGPEVKFVDGEIVTPQGERLKADLQDPAVREQLDATCLGERLRHGAVMHGGFFLGSQDFYQGLRDLPEEERRLIQMRSVNRINQLYGHEALDRLHRRDARFVNTCMMVTAAGAAVSDGLEDGTVISGVGGQYNFVAMAQELPDGRSILNLRSTRTSKGKVHSNIIWNYGHITIPRHLRDIYVTEYGVAFVRGKTDGEIIEELIKITDSRFQDDLVQKAKAAGKLSADYKVPEQYRANLPHVLLERMKPLKEQGLFPAFPLGCDFTEEELALGKALKALKAQMSTTSGRLSTLFGAFAPLGDTGPFAHLLKRMDLENPKNFKERLYRRLLVAQLRRSQA
ncbi:MAG: acetyl-CoA hydrolase [Deltaproteobacteria bacterium]|nr:MAG: acetyl-CoA hydrolase [Deltaproteobacteria bacterium]